MHTRNPSTTYGCSLPYLCCTVSTKSFSYLIIFLPHPLYQDLSLRHHCISSKLLQQLLYRSTFFCPTLSLFHSNQSNSFKIIVRLFPFSAQNLPMAFVCTKNKIQSLFLLQPRGPFISHLVASLIPFLTIPSCLLSSSPASSLAAPRTHDFYSTSWTFLPEMPFSQTTAWLFLSIPLDFCFHVTLS